LRCSKIQMAPDIGCNSFGQSHKVHSSARTHWLTGAHMFEIHGPILFVALCLCGSAREFFEKTLQGSSISSRQKTIVATEMLVRA
jgi:hypothetical protein